MWLIADNKNYDSSDYPIIIVKTIRIMMYWPSTGFQKVLLALCILILFNPHINLGGRTVFTPHLNMRKLTCIGVQ